MKKIKLFGLMATLTALAIPLIGASAAQAVTNNVSCTFTGATGNVNGTTGVQSISADAMDGTVIGDKGTYGDTSDPAGSWGDYEYSTSPDGQATCRENGGTPDSGAQIDATGTFENDLCGNIGSAPGTATVTFSNTHTYTADYTLEFVGGGAGVVGAQNAGDDISGAVDIFPTAGNGPMGTGNCASSNVTEFQASGEFDATVTS